MFEYNDKSFNCPLEFGVYLIRGKWKTGILCNLGESGMRFMDLYKRFPHVSQKVLTEQLREMENDKLINRVIFAEVPSKVEYSLTERGKSLLHILGEIEKWSNEFLAEVQQE